MKWFLTSHTHSQPTFPNAWDYNRKRVYVCVCEGVYGGVGDMHYVYVCVPMMSVGKMCIPVVCVCVHAQDAFD